MSKPFRRLMMITMFLLILGAAFFGIQASGEVWTFVDGNLATGLNKDTSKSALDQALAVYNNELYVAWSEVNASSVGQIRVRKYNGTSWTWVDGGGANGINSISM